ncbi:hypothetical protein [Frigoribacterium sp. CG_9.8]|uniref:hypothetical protein n=1 Tax=Frigoribacterium sp. CG_9.8 TaxID=2787733 RepID=UPI0018CB4035|nr:hypothetical protein [Frigoribacterium sp. CG_9.8]MBG6107755.1 hypothetical protein [Frigoribacterium sp. CG_9.8]
MAFWNRVPADRSLARNDRGSGSFNDYRYNLLPNSARTTLRLANSAACQDELQRIVDSGEGALETAISRRSLEEERTDAPMDIRLFSGSRVTGVVGTIPRGLEPVVDEALGRLGAAGRKTRIPASVQKTRSGWRVDLFIGRTR